MPETPSSTRTPKRPAWWPAWTDYPHGGISEKQARELSGYCVGLEAERDKLAAQVAEMRHELERAEETLKTLYVELGRLSNVAQMPLATVGRLRRLEEKRKLLAADPEGKK